MHPAARSSVLRPFRLLMLMWLFFSVSFFFNIDFGFLGILPRSYFGLIGIFTGPLVHGNFNHISSNSVPVLFLGTILYFFYPKIANRIFLQCYFFTNILVYWSLTSTDSAKETPLTFSFKPDLGFSIQYLCNNSTCTSP